MSRATDDARTIVEAFQPRPGSWRDVRPLEPAAAVERYEGALARALPAGTPEEEQRAAEQLRRFQTLQAEADGVDPDWYLIARPGTGREWRRFLRELAARQRGREAAEGAPCPYRKRRYVTAWLAGVYERSGVPPPTYRPVKERRWNAEAYA